MIAAAAIACLDDTPVAPRDARMQLGISAQLVAAHGHSVEIAVFYARTPERREIFRREFEIDTGVTAIPVTLDLQTCLADPERVGSRDGVCLLSVLLVLRDSARVVIDSGSVGEIEGTPGGSASTAPITLGVRAARFEVVSGQDQIGVAGLPLILPVELRAVDSAGGPLANRLVTIEAASGGGSPIATTVRTDENGIARIAYRLGTQPGMNTFRVASGSIATTIVSATGIRVQSRLAAGTLSTCALDAAGATRCWGSNMHGALGIPAVVGDTSLPLPVAGAPAFTAIAVGDANNITSSAACALTSAGAAYCWGVNHQGQLGVEATDTCTAFQTMPPPACTRRPMPVAGGHSFVSIGVGGSTAIYSIHACGVTAAGDAYCWGDNTNGELGIGTSVSTAAPVAVVGGLKFVQLSLGHGFTCGVTATAEAYCWGLNRTGALGDTSMVSSAVPVRIVTSERFVTISAGASRVCALTPQGEARCWGTLFGTPIVTRPTPIPGNHRFAEISNGLSHVCGLTAVGETWCWGFRGAVGDGSESGSVVDVPVRVRSNAIHRELSAGLHSCVRTANDELYCWYHNAWGQLGIGNRRNNPVPVRVNLLGNAPGAPTTITANTFTEGSASAGSAVSSGGPIGWNARVRVTDANGIAVAGVAVSFSASNGGSATSQTVTDVAGIAFPSWRLGTAPGVQTLEATAAGLTGSPVVFTATAVTPGPPVSYSTVLTRTQPVGQMLVLPPSGQVRDAAGYVVAGIPVTFSRTAGTGGTIQPPLPATILTNADGGVGLTSWLVDTIAGIDSVRIDVAGMAQPVYFSVIRTPLAASILEFTQQPQGAIAASVLTPPIRVTLRDRYGNVATTSTTQVSLALLGGTATLGGTTTVTPTNGVATFSDLTVSAAGTYQLRATVGALTATSAAFTVTP